MRIHAIFGGIGAFAVKFRWLVIAAWLIAAIAVPRFLPSLNSVTQGNNSAFLPASAPSEQAAQLAAPFGTTNLVPVQVIAAVDQGTLTTADTAWLATLQHNLATVPTVVSVRDLGRSKDQQAEQLQVLSDVNQASQPDQTTLVHNIRTQINQTAPPPGLQVHLAGQIAINVDQQTKSGSTGNQVEFVSVIFILILLLLIFRALLAPLITLIPAFFAVAISGPLVGEAAHAGLKVSVIAQLLLIVLVLGAGTDYGLFLVFRVRENLREGAEPKDAVRAAVTRVGETITFSALTVIAALLSLLVATFQIYSELGIPLAIGIGTMLLAGLTLLPALLAVFGRAVFWPSKTRAGTGKAGLWGRVAARIVRRPAIPLAIGVVGLGLLATGVALYQPGGFGGSITAPAGSDSAAGQALLAKHFPSSSANPTNLIYRLPQPVWDDPEPVATATSQLAASGLFTGVTGPLNPAGVPLTAAQYQALHAALGDPATLPSVPPANSTVPLEAYQAYRATAQYVSPDGRTIQFETGLKAGDPSTTAAMNAVPAVRTEAAAVAKTLGATAYGVGRRGTRLPRHQPDLRQRPGACRTGGDHRDRPAAVPGHSLAGRAAVPDRIGGAVVLRGPGTGLLPVHRARRGQRPHLYPPVLDVHLPARAGRGLQHPGDEPYPGGGSTSSATRSGQPGRRHDRHHGDLGRPGAGRDVLGVRTGRRAPVRRQPDRRRRRRAGPGRADGYLHRPHHPGAVHGHTAGPVELVAVQAQPGRPAASWEARAGQRARRAAVDR